MHFLTRTVIVVFRDVVRYGDIILNLLERKGIIGAFLEEEQLLVEAISIEKNLPSTERKPLTRKPGRLWKKQLPEAFHGDELKTIEQAITTKMVGNKLLVLEILKEKKSIRQWDRLLANMDFSIHYVCLLEEKPQIWTSNQKKYSQFAKLGIPKMDSRSLNGVVVPVWIADLVFRPNEVATSLSNLIARASEVHLKARQNETEIHVEPGEVFFNRIQQEQRKQNIIVKQQQRRIEIMASDLQVARTKAYIDHSGPFLFLYQRVLDFFEWTLPREKTPGKEIRFLFHNTLNRLQALRMSSGVSDFGLLSVEEQKTFRFPKRPFFSFFFTEGVGENLNHFQSTLHSLMQQTYLDFEVFVIGSTAKPLISNVFLTHFPDQYHKRIAYLEYGHYQEGFQKAQGDYWCFIETNDWLLPEALFEIALKSNAESSEIIYTDEAIGSRWSKQPVYKPDFAQETLLSWDYLAGLVFIEQSLIKEVGVPDMQNNPQWKRELMLELVSRAIRISHIRKVLNIRKIETERLPENWMKGKKILANFLKQKGIDALVSAGRYPGTYAVTYSLHEAPLVSIIIPFKNHFDYVERCLNSIFDQTTYPHFEVLCIDNNSHQKGLDALKKRYAGRKVRFMEYRHPFNFSALNNQAVKETRGSFLLFLNNDTEVISPNWIQELLMYAGKDKIGAVGAKLYYPDNTIQHAGLVFEPGRFAAHQYRYASRDESGYLYELHFVRNVLAVTAACMMVRKSTFLETGGFDESLAIAVNDVDFCLRLVKAGYRNVVTPFCELYHYESLSRGRDEDGKRNQRFGKELQIFFSKHGDFLRHGDPYYRSLNKGML